MAELWFLRPEKKPSITRKKTEEQALQEILAAMLRGFEGQNILLIYLLKGKH